MVYQSSHVYSEAAEYIKPASASAEYTKPIIQCFEMSTVAGTNISQISPTCDVKPCKKSNTWHRKPRLGSIAGCCHLTNLMTWAQSRCNMLKVSWRQLSPFSRNYKVNRNIVTNTDDKTIAGPDNNLKVVQTAGVYTVTVESQQFKP